MSAQKWHRETFCRLIPSEAVYLIDWISVTAERSEYGAILPVFLNDVASGLRARHIMREDGKPYMTRYAIHGFMPGDKPEDYPLSIYLHHFHTPDYDPAPHSHPWAWARSLILTGGYIERRVNVGTGEIARIAGLRPGDISRIDPSTFHVIEELFGDTWTLFSAGPKTNDWGFWNGERVVPWRDRMRERGLTPDY